MEVKLKKYLESKRLYYRPFKETDDKDVFEYSSDKETVKYLTWEYHKTIEESRLSLKNYLMNNDGVYAIVLKSTDKLIGCIDLRLMDNNKASFGYVLNRAYWNNGYMSEALKTMFDYLFNIIGVKEIVGSHERENIASGKVMIKCGMEWTHFVKDENVNNKIADYDHYIIKNATK